MPNSSVKKVCVGVLHRFAHMPTQPLSARYLHGNSSEDYSFCFAVLWYNRNVHDVHLRLPMLAGLLLIAQSCACMAVKVRLAWLLPKVSLVS